MMTIDTLSPINWALFNKNGRFTTIATNDGVWEVRYESEDCAFLTANEENTHSTFRLNDWFFTEPHYLYVRPGFKLFAEVPCVDPEAKTLNLRFGRKAYTLFPKQFPAQYHQVPLASQRKALKEANISIKKELPKSKLRHVEEYDEDSQGRLLYNGITGYYHRDPDCDNLNAGYYISRHGEVAGAAVDEEVPQIELKLFFAALRPKQRLMIAKALDKNEFDATAPIYGVGLYIDGENITLRGGIRHYIIERFDPEASEIFDEAIKYLFTLRPGKTKAQDAQVLECLQAVETGMEFAKRASEKIEAWDVLNNHGHNGRRLARFLHIYRGYHRRKTLANRWEKLNKAYKNLGLEVVAAELGLTAYPSRVWLHTMRTAELKERRQRRAETKANAERIAKEKAQYVAMLAKRQPSDVFQVKPHLSKDHVQIQVFRKGKNVEKHTVDRREVGVFRRLNHLNGRRYTRKYLTQLVDRLFATSQPSFKIHRFRRLFSDLGIISPNVATQAAA